MKDVIFLGPSLDLAQARAICPGDYRPPVRMGDVYRAACERPRSIVIIDGLFERIPAVWHKEILFALDRGIAVYGGSSMGALRAAELDAFGMIGIGSIYRDFASGVLNDDDEVAVAHGSAETGYLSTSTAMVNLRSGIAGAVSDGLLGEEQARALIASSKARFYPERTWEALLRDAPACGMDAAQVAALRDWLAVKQPDQKRDDAIEVLHALARARLAPQAPTRPGFNFEHTVYWETVETYCSSHGAAQSASQFERVRNHVRIFEEDRQVLLDRALLLFLVKQEARRLRLPPPDDRAALNTFRTHRGLESVTALNEWLAKNAVTQQECLELARLEYRLAQLKDRHILAIDEHLVPLLKLDDRFARVTARVSAKWKTIASMAVDPVSEQDSLAFGDVLSWYQRNHGRVAVSLELHAAELGIGSLHQLRQELFTEYLADAQVA